MLLEIYPNPCILFFSSEKQNNHVRAASPSHYVIEAARSNGHIKQESPRIHADSLLRPQKESTYSRTYEASRRQTQPEQEHRKTRNEHRQREEPPSPPVRRKLREQVPMLFLRQGPALEGRNSPVFEKRFWKGNK